MPASKVQLIGGNFQDSEGNVLANGYLKMLLSQDGTVTGVGSICSGIEVTIKLNASGSVDTGTPQYIWGNDSILPVNTFYRVTGYTAQGQPAWGPNNQQVAGSGTFDTGTWIPNQVISWTPPPTTTLLETNGTKNGSQSLLNLKSGSNITLTDDGTGDVTIAAASGIVLQTNHANNGNQSKLDLVAGANITLTDDGSGNVSIVGAAQTGPASLPQPTVSKYILWTPSLLATSNNYGANNLSIQSDAITTAGAGSANGTAPQAGVFPPNATTGVLARNFSNYASQPGGIGSTAYVQGQALLYPGRNINFSTRIQVTSNHDQPGLSNGRWWFGLFDPLNSGGGGISFISSNNPTAINFIGFLFDPSVTANVRCGVGNGSATTFVTTGVAFTDQVMHKLTFTVNASAPSVTFFIDGVQVAVISTNVPTTQALGGIMSVFPVANIVMNPGFGFEHFYADNVSL